MKTYIILHTRVGPWEKDRVITEDMLHDANINDVQRLINLGAIADTDAPKTETPVPNGPENLNTGEGSGGGKPPIPENLARMKKDELQQLAEKRGIESSKTMSKDELIANITADAEGDDGTGDEGTATDDDEPGDTTDEE
jgi:hypothetical protein